MELLEILASLGGAASPVAVTLAFWRVSLALQAHGDKLTTLASQLGEAKARIERLEAIILDDRRS